MANQREFGLALGGGAARGIAHIGVMKVLDESGVRPSVICGTSAGSIVGTLYAGGHSWMDILEIVQSIDWGDMVQGVFPRKGLLRATRLEKRLRELLDDRDLDDLDIPCRTVAVDLISADEYIFRDGPAAIAVRASCSIPGIFEPVETDDQVLVDGGVLNDVPVDVAFDMGADYVLGVNLNADLLPNRRPENVFQILTASFEVLARGCRELYVGDRQKDVMIVEPQLKDFSYQDLRPVDELVQRGEDAMRASMPDLLAALKKRKIPTG